MLAAAVVLVLPPGDAFAAKRSEKQLEMDRQREEMRRLAEEKRKNPSIPMQPPVSDTGRALIIPPSSTGRTPELPPAPPPAPAPAAPVALPASSYVVPPPAPPAPPSRVVQAPNPPAPSAGTKETAEEMVARAVGRPTDAGTPALEQLPSSAGGAADPLLANAAFQRGAKLFNSALEIFRRFESDHIASRLSEIPPLSEQAAKAFEECRTAFPNDPRIARYIEQCYGLTRYARQSELMSGKGLRN